MLEIFSMQILCKYRFNFRNKGKLKFFSASLTLLIIQLLIITMIYNTLLLSRCINNDPQQYTTFNRRMIFHIPIVLDFQASRLLVQLLIY